MARLWSYAPFGTDVGYGTTCCPVLTSAMPLCSRVIARYPRSWHVSRAADRPGALAAYALPRDVRY
eukprot:3862471-Rhodomonas_salina.3